MESPILRIENFYAYFGETEILKNINLSILPNEVTAIMGPSGCGKTTLIRCINRMHELANNTKVSGRIFLHQQDIYSANPIVIRRKIGMVFQKPNPFPTMSIYENVISGFTLNGIKLKKSEKDKIVEDSLKKAELWEEVKKNIYRRGTFLSGGQQQRLCIARALAMNPDIILLDEPTSALDPKSTSAIESLIVELKKNITIVIVTHNTAQAARISDWTAFLYLGEMVEYDTTEKMFTVPKDKRTEEYLTGKFG
ncbi:MAG: phosphate ABC transporter ATP-binding protein PstB [Candidatus Omnitrophica bacterium]|nr:phosphate ABC transporter ATP-binding protein PstB [Candidatus Omnitrophota bacterium]